MGARDVELLEELMELPRTISNPEMDLEGLKRIDDYIRKQWWEKLRSDELRYYNEFVIKGRTNEFLASYMILAKLKLITSFLDGNELCPEHKFSEMEIDFLRQFDEFKLYDRLTEAEIVDYVNRGEADEGGIVKLASDAALNGYDQMDSILKERSIPNDLAKAFKKIYQARITKVETAAKEYITKFNLYKVWKDVEKVVENSVSERERTISELNQRLSGLESRSEEAELVREEKEKLERELRALEGELISKESDRSALLSKIGTLESERKRVEQKYAGLESSWTNSLQDFEARRRDLESQEAKLREMSERQKEALKEVARQATESELAKIRELKEELRLKEEEIENQREVLQNERNDVEEKLEAIKDAIEGGETKRLVTRDVAQIQELNFISRFEKKMSELPRKIYRPDQEKEVNVKSWSYHYRFDDGDKILSKSGTDYDEIRQKMPLNLRSRYVVAEKKFKLFGKERTKVVVEAMVLNHLESYLENRFDTQSATLSELLSVLTKYIDRADLGNYFHLLGIASSTGWDSKVLEHINSTEFHRNFVSRYVSLCLVDLESGEVFYNATDEKAKAYLPLFELELNVEKVERCKELIKKKLSLKDYVVLDDVVKEASENAAIVKRAFYELENEGIGKAKYVKDIGLVLKQG